MQNQTNRPGGPLPPGQTESAYHSSKVKIGLFVFDPNLVQAFQHRPGSDTTTPITEVIYQTHLITVDDPNQALFFYLVKFNNPKEINSTL